MKEKVKRFRFLWQAHPLRALVEAWILGIGIIFLLSRVVGRARPDVFDNGVLMLCGSCGMWMVLRTRIPRMHPFLQVFWELSVGVALSLMMVLGLRWSVNLLRWSEVWLQSRLSVSWSDVFQSNLDVPLTTILLLLTGIGYLFARIGVRIWRFWNRVQARRMLLSLTHAHLTVVVLMMVLMVFLNGIGFLWSGDPDLPEPADSGVIPVIADRILMSIMPLISVSVVMTIVLLIMLLPPSAIFSYFVARRTTRRLETLATATKALRGGDLSARVPVEGEDEVAQLQDNFNVMATDLERATGEIQTERDKVASLLKSRRELIVNVSHELRTPVATIRGYLESSLAGSNEDPLELQHDLEVMAREVERLQGLIDDLFTLARAEVDGLAMELSFIDVGELVQRRVKAMAPLAWQKERVEVVAEVPPDLPHTLADAGRLEQVLVNLLRNGVRHTPPGGIVAVVVAIEDDAVRIEVRDTGEGIPSDDLPYVWERFYRGESARVDDDRGAGLGLALVKELTEAMEGTVAVESVVGQGSCFTVRLPQA
ncbi:MAG: HAMP domain-containing histidine kinase [Chloroflexi bacterium]|nr:HAMP domain-containing histidine kinase [Chloroflexota bacterium]